MATVAGVEIQGALEGRAREILTPEAVEFVSRLQREFNPRREQLLQARQVRAQSILNGERPDFLDQTRGVREGSWTTAPPPADLLDRRVEITGPVERKMMINALNSGARVFMADFEDANSPTWENNLQGHVNLIDANEGTIAFENPDGKQYRLNEKVAKLLVRPRGWHLLEKHVKIDGRPVSGSLFDFGLYVFHNTRRRLDRGEGTYFYLPKLESHLEARLWNDVFTHSEDELHVARGTMRGTVLIETILAAFEMDEILHELREHSIGLNAGRWDYIFSVIKKFNNDPKMILPDRVLVSMTVPFMRAYTELLVKTCHRRGTFAMGGMAAFIPSRKDADVNDLAMRKVREDKEREARDGFDGTWVAHPDLVPIATECFDAVLGDQPNQIQRRRDEVKVTAEELIELAIPDGRVTDAGLRLNISVGIQYIESWLRGNGAAAINNLMEDAATAEISRSQVWQWVHNRTRLDDGREVTPELVRQIEEEELRAIRATHGDELFGKGRFEEATKIFERVALADRFEEFLTVPAYELVD